MSFSGTFTNWLKNTQASLRDQVKKFQNRDFMDAVVAGCALVAAADGHIESSEKQKMASYINRSEELKVFDMNDVISRFNHFVSGFEFDHGVGKMEALKAIGKLKNNPEAARILIGVCCAIGAADGDFDEKEKIIVREICQTVNLNPADFQL
ncbi:MULTISPECIES: tellurite resistance TerB family protein [Brevibacillus]|uniref:Probable tellurium resistance protein n=1 Tax=Brevibacillus brevis (strain 47 / JCM 6285 / NBRC 100599) TaxID=358681 RepID=C0Z9Y4_BREBN|nr:MULTISPECIES: tellurite resistance TerB family protein [Bacillales]NRR03915.1 tellurite resistance TerB family protein [Brevibacillus sp. RS1.1]NRS50807.1 tellurite resistance TerB family protein [Brevibacillus sp. HB2.2]TQR34831.1 Tellurite resistance TerB [Lysinibacillus sp. SDF0063]UIO42510.1 tellurite resistance TerB family protein [Brevibacillus brevis]BAH46838.1 probable tellurium resistance protein [Brevibacillus brevis NBRC 100599]